MRFFAFALLAIVTVAGNEEKKICEPGAFTKVDCNDCICSKDGTRQSCTLILCEPKRWHDVRVRRQAKDEDVQAGETNLQTKKICEPGAASKVDCNHCICSKDGTFLACTFMICLPEVLDNVTIQRETIENVGEAGKIIEEKVQLVSKSPLLRRKRQVNYDRPCEAGKKFNIFCNTCTCGSDGFSVACTRMHCPKGLYNEDGSLNNIRQVPTNPL